MTFEIERKFLIELSQPQQDFLEMLRNNIGVFNVSVIRQIYLVSNDCERRIRFRASKDETKFYYTEKIAVSGIKRIENEREITMTEYSKYLREADLSINPIEKTRYTLLFSGQKLEIDVYNFCKDKAILEIELPSEDSEIKVPDCIKVIKEVTYDPNYKNKSLAQTQKL